ncbi:PE family protein, partial [Mycobacterium marinum]
MSFVVADPELLAVTATDLAGIGSALNAAHGAAAAPTTGVLAAGADEVSGAIAALFSDYGQAYQSVSARMAALHDQFVRAMTGAAVSYAGSEAANASPLETLAHEMLGVVNAPTQALLGRPLIGNGADGTAASPNGGAGGLLLGN